MSLAETRLFGAKHFDRSDHPAACSITAFAVPRRGSTICRSPAGASMLAVLQTAAAFEEAMPMLQRPDQHHKCIDGR
ncbi:hypothetical protein IC762_27755 [Bradyrhizobium genosp. L]|uniref:hypothetical protein n=1 Tax=Bradyrhizobium genosp. L TaxID=83637 RepID=UPI0018A28916|nr:hypothetical protein [Bradyrhizobium genosp. L]QPF83470.1 hypothetical protein IC762_27755 [Bradyrhizobium genosp. L]